MAVASPGLGVCTSDRHSSGLGGSWVDVFRLHRSLLQLPASSSPLFLATMKRGVFRDSASLEQPFLWSTVKLMLLDLDPFLAHQELCQCKVARVEQH